MFNNFIMEGNKTRQDCVNGIILIFGKTNKLHLKGINCKSDVLMPLAEQLDTRTNTVEFEDCIMEHPDLDPKQRVVPLYKEICLSIALNSKLLNMNHIEHLELK